MHAGLQADAIAYGHSTGHVQPLVMCCSWRPPVYQTSFRTLASSLTAGKDFFCCTAAPAHTSVLIGSGRPLQVLHM